MNITKTKKYTLIKVQEISNSIFLEDFTKNFSKFKNEQLIIDFSDNINMSKTELELFLNLNNQHRENGTSFVIICTNTDVDSLPDELSIVPTLMEAEDIIEMEAIERDLGF